MEKQRKRKHGLLISAIAVFSAGAVCLGGAVLAGGLNRDAWVNANTKLRAGQGLYEEPVKVSLKKEDIGAFSSIDFDVSSHGVMLEKGTGEEFEFSFAKDFEEEFTVGVTDGKLSLVQRDTNPQGKGFFKYFQTNIDWILGFFDGWEDLYKVKLTVPDGFEFDKIGINCTSGAVSLNGISAAEVNIRATSGSVHIDNTEAGKLDLLLTSGSLRINDVKADEINATLTSGGARLNNVSATGIKALLTSGSFHLTGVTADDLRAELTSGGLKVGSSDIKASYIDLSSGSATFSDMPVSFSSAATYFNVKVTSGSIRIDGDKKASPYVTPSQDAAYKIEGKLTSGSFKFA